MLSLLDNSSEIVFFNSFYYFNALSYSKRNKSKVTKFCSFKIFKSNFQQSGLFYNRFFKSIENLNKFSLKLGSNNPNSQLRSKSTYPSYTVNNSYRRFFQRACFILRMYCSKIIDVGNNKIKVSCFFNLIFILASRHFFSNSFPSLKKFLLKNQP